LWDQDVLAETARNTKTAGCQTVGRRLEVSDAIKGRAGEGDAEKSTIDDQRLAISRRKFKIHMRRHWLHRTVAAAWEPAGELLPGRCRPSGRAAGPRHRGACATLW